MGDPPKSQTKTSSIGRSPASRIATIFFVGLFGCLVALAILSFLHKFYWDDEQRSSIFFWDGFIFFLTKGPAVKIGGAIGFTSLGALLTTMAGFLKSDRTVARILWLCAGGILLTLILWIKLYRDDLVFGELSALANNAFVRAPPEARIGEVSAAIDYLMGSLLGWWIATAGAVLALRKAAQSGGLERAAESISKLLKKGAA